MKLGICAWVLPGDELDSFELAGEFGLDGVVIDFGNMDDKNPLLTDYGQKVYMAAAEKYKLKIPTMAINSYCSKGFTKCVQMDDAKEVLNAAIDVAAKMNIEKLQIPSFYDNLVHTDDDLTNTIEFFKYACELGEKNGVLIGTESVLTIKQHQRLVKEVSSSNLATLFDTQNPWRMVNQDGPRMAKYMMPYTKELHAKDSNLSSETDTKLGEGDVEFDKMMTMFAEYDFDRWVQLESNYSNMSDYKTILQSDITKLQKMFDD